MKNNTGQTMIEAIKLLPWEAYFEHPGYIRVIRPNGFEDGVEFRFGDANGEWGYDVTDWMDGQPLWEDHGQRDDLAGCSSAELAKWIVEIVNKHSNYKP